MSNKVKNIENRGWEEMSILLEKHMPQEKKHRPVFPFWSATAAASLIVLSGLFILNSKDKNIDFVSESKSIQVDGEHSSNTPLRDNSKIVSIVTEETKKPAYEINTSINNTLIKTNELGLIGQISKFSPEIKRAITIDNEDKDLSRISLSQISSNTNEAELSIALSNETMGENQVELGNTAINAMSTSETSKENSMQELIQNSMVEEVSAASMDAIAKGSSIETTKEEIKNTMPKECSPNMIVEDALAVDQHKLISKTDFYISPTINALFNIEDKNRSTTIGLDLGYKVNKFSFEIGGEYISNNRISLTSNEVKDYITSRLLSTPSAIQLPIEKLSTGSSFAINNGSLLALNAKVNYDLSKKIGIYAGVQRSQGLSLEQIQITSNAVFLDNKNSFPTSLELSSGNSSFSQNGLGISYVGSEKSSFSYLLGLSYKILKRLNINVGVRSNYRPKNSINEYAVAENLPLFAIGASYKMF
jgi:opacity protein-like surface antigen